MRSTIESEIRARVEAFADELVSLIQTSALEAVQGALGEDGGRRRGRGPAPSVRPVAERGGGKRDPEVIAALTDELHAYISKNPGKRIEEIGAALETPTRDLVLPVRRLIAAKRITTKGQKRATTYFAGGGRASAAPTKKKAGRAAPRAAKKRGKRAAPKARGRAPSKRRRGGAADSGSDKAAESAAGSSAE